MFNYLIRGMKVMNVISSKLPKALEDGQLSIQEISELVQDVLDIFELKSTIEVPENLKNTMLAVKMAIDPNNVQTNERIIQILIEFIEHCHDFDGPVLDISPSNEKESFTLGILFQKIVQNGKCVWVSDCCIRIPLIDMDDIGLAILPVKKEMIPKRGKYIYLPLLDYSNSSLEV